MSDELPINTRLNGDRKDRFIEYLQDQNDTSKYEASRTLIDEGLRRRGYHPSEDAPATRLQQRIHMLAVGFAIAGLILTGMSIAGNPGVQVYTVAVLAASIVLEASNSLASTHLERVAGRIRGVMASES